MFDPYLQVLADSLDDIERTKNATANRLRQLTRTEADSDGHVRGLGLDERSPEVAQYKALLTDLERIEHENILKLQRQLRKNPLHAWVKNTKGIGEKTAARLLSAIGDPYWNDLHDRPRTVSELWSYAGYGVSDGAAVRRAKGVKSNWTTVAKTRAYLLAESVVKAGIRKDENGERYATTDLAQVYIDRRVRTAESHPDWTAGHSHADALRVLAKEILKSLWLAARDVHENS